MAGRNRADHVALISKPSWLTWKGSKVARYIRFVETMLIVPKGYGARGKFTLHPYQRDMFEDWLDPSTRAAMLKIGRGNAKTTTVGAFGVAHLFMDEDGDVPVVASTMTQAKKTTYGAMSRLIQLSPELAGRTVEHTGIGTTKLLVPSMNSTAYPIADSEEGLQGLDPSVAVLDEAAFASMGTWSALVMAGGKRPDSICVGIGTPSFESHNAMLDAETSWRSGKRLPGFHFREHRAPDGCDHRDESVWHLANPALRVQPALLGIDALRMDIELMPEQAFRCFRLAQWPTAATGGWLGDGGAEAWDRLEDRWEFMPDRETYAAVDMALKNDCAAIVAGQFRDDGRLHAKAWIWYPGGGNVDPNEIMDELRRLHQDFRLVAVPYDPRYFELGASVLYDEGLPMMEIPQSVDRMTPAVMGCHESIHRGGISHDGDVAFRDHVLSAQPRYSDRGFTLSKMKSGHKIDAAVALCMMHYAARSQTGAGLVFAY